MNESINWSIHPSIESKVKSFKKNLSFCGEKVIQGFKLWNLVRCAAFPECIWVGQRPLKHVESLYLCTWQLAMSLLSTWRRSNDMPPASTGGIEIRDIHQWDPLISFYEGRMTTFRGSLGKLQSFHHSKEPRFASFSAPLWSSKRTTSAWPWKAATCKGIAPLSLELNFKLNWKDNPKKFGVEHPFTQILLEFEIHMTSKVNWKHMAAIDQPVKHASTN